MRLDIVVRLFSSETQSNPVIETSSETHKRRMREDDGWSLIGDIGFGKKSGDIGVCETRTGTPFA